MKKILQFHLATSLLLLASISYGQDKAARPSPPAEVSATLPSGATIKINYSQPSVKGRTIGKDLEPLEGKVWRMGANEATVFETDKDVEIEGKTLPAGKYSLFGITDDDDEMTLIFNSNWKIWGTQYEKNRESDVLRVEVPFRDAKAVQEKLTYQIDKKGKVSLLWGDKVVEFKVK
jgi:hypothetical protein